MVGGNWVSSGGLNCTSSGIYNLGNANGTGSPLLVGGCELVGVTGTGTFNQTCGTNAIIGGGAYAGTSPGNPGPFNNVAGCLALGWYSGYQISSTCGYGMGTYNLKGGLLIGNPGSEYTICGFEVVGVSGKGIFNHTAGTNSCTELSVGGIPDDAGYRLSFGNGSNYIPYNSATGLYNLNGGFLTVNGGAETVGAAGNGTFTQTAGINLAGQLQLAGYAVVHKRSGYTYVATPGTYNLGGGLFQVGNITVGDNWNGTIGQATFNFTGGTLQAAPGGLTAAIPITLAPSSPVHDRHERPASEPSKPDHLELG